MTESPQPQAEPTKGKSCAFWGCVICTLLSGLSLVVAVVVITLSLNKFQEIKEDFVQDEPGDIPVYTPTAEETAAVEDKTATFMEKYANGEAQAVTLNESELNTLIASNPDFEDLKGKAYFTVRDDAIGVQANIPLDDFGMEGKFLNGQIELELVIRDGRYQVYAKTLKSNGKDLPAQLMNQLRRVNLTEELANDVEAQKLFERISSIEVRNGKLHIRTKDAAPLDDVPFVEEEVLVPVAEPIEDGPMTPPVKSEPSAAEKTSQPGAP